MTLTPLRRRAARVFSGLPILSVVLAVVLPGVAGLPAASAQVLYGSMVGHVHDSTGAALPGATVVILQSVVSMMRCVSSMCGVSVVERAITSARDRTAASTIDDAGTLAPR